MGIARTVQTFLANRGVSYDVLTHQPTSHALATARACDVSRDTLAKGILIRRKDGYLLAVLPASRKVRLADLAAWLNEPVALATEAEVTQVFADCEPGSVPPVAGAYGLSGVVDDSLEGFDHIYFEAGDHCSLLHVTGRGFHRLMVDLPHVPISAPVH